MFSVADDSLFSTWQHRHQKRKGRRAKVHCLPGFLSQIFWYLSLIIWVPKETAKDQSVQLSRWGGLLVPGPDYPPSPSR
jgi:hypothetical protein